EGRSYDDGQGRGTNSSTRHPGSTRRIRRRGFAALGTRHPRGGHQARIIRPLPARGERVGVRGNVVMRTQVGIVGAGPAGLLLSHLLHLRGIESVVVEARSRDYVEQRVRAGTLEQGTVDLLVESGAGERLQREALVRDAIELRFGRRRHPLNLRELSGGRPYTIYAQQEIVKDLIGVRLAGGGRVLFEAADVSVHDFD